MVAQPAIADQLSRGQLPPHAANSEQLLDVLMDPDKDIPEVAAAIELHVVIVGKLISLANSAWSNPIRPITALDEACARLGLGVVRTLSIALAVGRSFAVASCPEFDPKRYWMSSIITSGIASKLASELDVDPGTARAAGLLHNIGLLWLADRAPRETGAALRAAGEDCEHGIDAHLRQQCGIGYREAGHLLMSRWGMPERLLMCFSPSAAADSAPDARQIYDLVHVSSEMTANVLSEPPDADSEYHLAGMDSKQLNGEIQYQISMLHKTDSLASVLVRPG